MSSPESFAEEKLIGVSSNGRTAGFEPVNVGSIPTTPSRIGVGHGDDIGA